ncbi:E3 ubiquitin-protein ligase RNF169 isoform X1 [Poecilia formosa]|uniref:E3 ubiquitin-protein ligase RNF169 isoform X1 n=1 Tax=Poecilia formosa TaxID=48698 RepID=UPI000444844F|nr:PREDICTED: E3 ubiquitin-protein ligase RNF169 isoform X1 [Poecilia formosa]
MATAGFAEQRSTQAGTAADTSRSRPGTAGAARCRSGSGPPEKCSACSESRSGSGTGTACSRCLARRVPGREERIRRRSDPERGSSRAGKRDSESRRGVFVCPTLPKSADAPAAPSAKLKVSLGAFRKSLRPEYGQESVPPLPVQLLASDDREEIRKWSCLMGKDESGSVRRAVEPGVLSDSENEEPISRRIRNISAFIRKTKNSSAVSSGSRRSRSCTDPLEDRGGKMKAIVPPAAVMEQVGISHSSAAGILLSSENSRSISAPITAPDRRLTWRAVLTSSAPLGLPPPPARAERSISPESNDSISEELNHFKPIVCSPCTPPKRLPDGRLLEPTVVKATPRNLSRSLQKATSYEASPAVLQKWRQIELDRQGLKVSTRATLTSPAPEPEGGGASKALQHCGSVALANRRRLLFEPPDMDGFQKQSVKIRVPAVRYGCGAALRGCSDLESAGAALEPGGGPAPFGRKHSFSPCNNSGFRPGKLVPKDSLSPRKEWDGICNQSTSRRGKKRNQKTKHLDPALDPVLDPALKRSRPSGQQEAPCSVQQERQDRALALRLQRQFDLEVRRTSPDRYFLRSWRSTQNRRRRGLRTSRPISKKL